MEADHTSFRRILPLERGFNFRDFGGYPTTLGGMVKQGKLFRSGTMSLLTSADEQMLRSLGILAICDFRHRSERETHPTRWHVDSGVTYWCRDYDEPTGALVDQLHHANARPEDIRQTMKALYRDIVVDHAPAYAEMFSMLAQGNLPLLINCTAGKDRTGVGAALVLAALGVSHERILADYTATNTVADWIMLFDSDSSLQQHAHSNAEANAQLLLADPSYLEDTLKWIETERGGLESYLSNIGIDSHALATIRDALIES